MLFSIVFVPLALIVFLPRLTSRSENSPSAPSAADEGTFPPTNEPCVDTVVVAAPVGTGCDGSDASCAPQGSTLFLFMACHGMDMACYGIEWHAMALGKGIYSI